MHNGTFGPDKICQEFYYPLNHLTMPGWSKGMEQIIHKRDLWPEKGMLTQCPGFKCPPGCTDCCCQCLLFYQPDFMAQKSELEELITTRGHICDFYPKFHCASLVHPVGESSFHLGFLASFSLTVRCQHDIGGSEHCRT